MSATYRIVRFYFNTPIKRHRCIIGRGLTLEQARAYCQRLDTSSSTDTSAPGIRRARRFGTWFDRYEKE